MRTLSRPTLALHRPCSRRPLHWSALWSARRSCARWRRCIYRTRPSLRRNHSSLLHNRLAWYRLGRGRRCGSFLWASCCHRRRCRRLLRCCGRWRNHNCWRMCGRSNHYRRRSGGLFNWRRRNYCRRQLDNGRCNHSTSFRCRSSRFGDHSGGLLCRRRRRCRSRFHGRRRSSR